MTLAPNSLQARDIAYVVHPYTNLRQHERQGPLTITGGDGVFVIDDDGNRYLEGLAGLWCTGLGFSEKRLAEAAKRQMEKLPYIQTFSHRTTDVVVELSEKLISIAPAPLAKAYFVNSGSEAIDTAHQADLVLPERSRPAGEEEDPRRGSAPITGSRSQRATSPAHSPTRPTASTCRWLTASAT